MLRAVDWARVHRRDGPGLPNARKAGRAAIVSPLVTAIGMFVFDDDALAMFMMFGAFVPLVFADYGGPLRRRAGAFVVEMVLGSLAIVVGAVLSEYAFLGAVGMFAIAFGATLATGFGGYTALHVAPILLAYSLSVLDPLPGLGIFDRVAGWVMGGAAAMVAAIGLWPIKGPNELGQAVVGVIDQLIGALKALGDETGTSSSLERARDAVTRLQADQSTQQRPSGPSRRAVSEVHLVEHLEEAVDSVAVVATGWTGAEEDHELVAAVVAALGRARSELAQETQTDEPADGWLEPVDMATATVRVRLAAESDREEDDLTRLRRLQATTPLVMLAHLAMWISYDAALAAGSQPRLGPLDNAPELSAAPADGLLVTARRLRRFARWELDPEGVILRNSIRAGTALGAAVLLAEVLPVEHGFWVALAALSVLRSGASTTLATALQAIVGTVAGFAVAALMILAVGDSELVLWLLFPLVAAIAAYSPGAIHYAVGQAAFGVLVVLLLMILDVPGFGTDLVRLETVSIGALTAVISSLVFWPRGARAALVRTVASLYRAASAAAGSLVGAPAGRIREAESDLTAARRRAEGAFCAALAEHSEPIDAGTWVSLLRPANLVRALLLGILPPARSPVSACGRSLDLAGSAANTAADRLTKVAEDLDRGQAAPTRPAPRIDPAADLELEGCLAATQPASDQRLDAIALVAWVEVLGRLTEDADRAGRDVARLASARAPVGRPR